MKCFLCKGTLENKLTTFMVDLGNCIVIVKNVPSQVCTQCGEVSYSDEVAARLEQIISQVKNSLTEIAVINYPSAAWIEKKSDRPFRAYQKSDVSLAHDKQVGPASKPYKADVWRLKAPSGAVSFFLSKPSQCPLGPFLTSYRAPLGWLDDSWSRWLTFWQARGSLFLWHSHQRRPF